MPNQKINDEFLQFWTHTLMKLYALKKENEILEEIIMIEREKLNGLSIGSSFVCSFCTMLLTFIMMFVFLLPDFMIANYSLALDNNISGSMPGITRLGTVGNAGRLYTIVNGLIQYY